MLSQPPLLQVTDLRLLFSHEGQMTMGSRRLLEERLHGWGLGMIFSYTAELMFSLQCPGWMTTWTASGYLVSNQRSSMLSIRTPLQCYEKGLEPQTLSREARSFWKYRNPSPNSASKKTPEMPRTFAVRAQIS